MNEPRDIRLKRLHMRSMRRGTKEMDILLMRFAEAHLQELNNADLDLYDALLDENDQDLYLWVSAQSEAPEPFKPLINLIGRSRM